MKIIGRDDLPVLRDLNLKCGAVAKQKPLNQYEGPLTAKQTAEGINAARLNAKRLADDAKLLLHNGRFPTATSLAMLAIEEFGKTDILRHILLSESDKELHKGWQRYRKHTEKNHFALVLDLVRRGARSLSDFRTLFTEATHLDRQTYDIIKQLGFYTDCCGNAHWSSPPNVIDEGIAIPLVQFAVALTKGDEPVTTEELELWAMYMSTGMTQENLIRWCEAMVAAGLKEPGYAEEMNRFL